VTVEDRIVIDLTDVLAVHCECRNCHTVIAYPLAQWTPGETQCPGCRQPWWTPNNPGLDQLRQFANLWRLIGERQNQPHDVNARVRLRFLIPRPDGESFEQEKSR